MMIWMSMMNRALHSVNHHFFFFYYYLEIIQRCGIHFGSRQNAIYFETKVTRSVKHHIIPIICTFIFGTLNAIQVVYLLQDYQRYPYLAWSEVLPPNGRRNFHFTLVFWSSMHLCCLCYVIRSRLLSYQFLAILTVDEKGTSGVTATELGFSSRENFSRFESLRSRAMWWLHFINYYVTVNASAAVFFQYWWKNLFRYNLAWMLYWLVHIPFWICYVSTIAYSLPILSIIMGYYFYTKQNSIMSRMDWVNQYLSKMVQKSRGRTMARLLVNGKFVQINASFTSMQHEFREFNPIMRRHLTVFLTFYICLITYCTYLIFLTSLPLDFKVLYSMIYAIHIILLTIAIFTLAQVSKCNQILGSKMIRFIRNAIRSGIFHPVDILKFDNILQSLLQNRLGFRLIDNYLINQRTFFVVFHLISAFFFLVFRNNRKTQHHTS